ncbi:MAG: AmmeMemoRadiSam system protein B [Acidobacteriota bacterium]
MPLRPAAVAGAWYPDDPARLAAAVTGYLDAVALGGPPPDATLVGLIAPHAGLMYSGPVAAHAYAHLRGRRFDAAVLIGPSHFVAFEGVSIWPRGAFRTPLGDLPVEERVAASLLASPVIHERPAAHEREHSLELQLPFLAHLAPGLPIVPLVMGSQDRDTVTALADALASALGDARVLLVASSDLSHYYDATTAAALDGQVVRAVDAFDADGLMGLLERRPDHACGGGPMVSVLSAARALGATEAAVVRYADSGDVSGDKASVVGYLAATISHA